jgi:hypothetical protein
MSSTRINPLKPHGQRTLATPAPPTEAQLKFDYEQLDEAERKPTINAAMLIKAHTQRTTESILIIGRLLTERKAALPHGQFQDWLETEFEDDLSPRNAQYFMRVHETFAGIPNVTTIFNLAALKLLSAPSTLPETRQRILDAAAETGEAPPVREIRRQIQADQPPARPLGPANANTDSHLETQKPVEAATSHETPVLGQIAPAAPAAPRTVPPALPTPEEIDASNRQFTIETLILNYESALRTLPNYLKFTADEDSAEIIRKTLQHMIDTLKAL